MSKSKNKKKARKNMDAINKGYCPICKKEGTLIKSVTSFGTFVRCKTCDWYTFNTNDKGEKKAETKTETSDKSIKVSAHNASPSKGFSTIESVTRYHRTCNHFETPVQIGQYEVWASASADSPKGARKRHPDLGVYLATDWRNITHQIIWGAGVNVQCNHPVVHVDWTDYQGIPIEDLAILVDMVVDAMKAGKKVEIGCHGAHGRTGTLLAAIIMKVEGKKADEAVLSLRSRYCHKAVESAAQLNTLRRYGNEPIVKEVLETDPQDEATLSATDLDRLYDGGMQGQLGVVNRKAYKFDADGNEIIF